jgi:hypothetical protein
MKTLLACLLIAFGSATTVLAQEVAPEKTFRYTVEYSGVKTEQVALDAQTELAQVAGLENVSMNWPYYRLTFVTTNHRMQEGDLMADVKRILESRGIALVVIRKEEVQP